MKINLNKIFLCTLIISACVAGYAIGQSSPVSRSFPGVNVFTTSAGRFGFFEQGTGKIFVYDGNLTDCVYIGQLVELGKPIEKIQ